MPTNSFRSPTSALAILVQPIFLSIKILERDSGGDETSLWNYDIIKRTKLSSIPREQCVTLNKTANFSLNRCRSFPTAAQKFKKETTPRDGDTSFFSLLNPPKMATPYFFSLHGRKMPKAQSNGIGSTQGRGKFRNRCVVQVSSQYTRAHAMASPSPSGRYLLRLIFFYTFWIIFLI